MNLKRRVAFEAVKLVESGMVVGLGTGSTTKYAIEFLGKKIREGQLQEIVGVPTSNGTAVLAASQGIPLGDLAEYEHLDLAIDGADEVTPELNLMKGWGGALVREKLVELHADRLIIIVDESKLVARLGTRGPLPVEVSQFAWQAQARWLARVLSCRVTRRQEKGRPYITDNHNFILHCSFEAGIDDPDQIQAQLGDRPGLVGHGLFLNMTPEVLVGTGQGEVKRLHQA